MDWAKAKTILIVVLLVFCLILTGVLVARDVKAIKQLSENKKASIAYLESIGVTINAEVPIKRIKLPVLFVECNSQHENEADLSYKKYIVYTNDSSSACYQITAEGERKAEIMPASSAIVEATSRFGSQEFVIEKIELCYYIDNDSFGISDGSSDTAFPAWRVESSAGTCYVLAY